MFQDEEFSSDSDDSRLGSGSGACLLSICVYIVCVKLSYEQINCM